MKAQTLLLTLMSLYATGDQYETCVIVMDKLTEMQKENVLPKRMMRRAIKAQQELIDGLQK